MIGGMGTALVIAEQLIHAIEKCNYDAEFLGFAFKNQEMKTILGRPIMFRDYEEMKEKYLGYNDVKFIFQLYRADCLKERCGWRSGIGIPMAKYCNFIHPYAYVANSAKINGNGNVILANVVINTNAIIGNFNTFNSGALVGHDTSLGDTNFIAAQTCIGSNVHIGDMNFLGLNSCVRNECNIGDENIIGMASNVTKSVGNNQLLYGNPATVQSQLNHVIR